MGPHLGTLGDWACPLQVCEGEGAGEGEDESSQGGAAKASKPARCPGGKDAGVSAGGGGGSRPGMDSLTGVGGGGRAAQDRPEEGLESFSHCCPAVKLGPGHLTSLSLFPHLPSGNHITTMQRK